MARLQVLSGGSNTQAARPVSKAKQVSIPLEQSRDFRDGEVLLPAGLATLVKLCTMSLPHLKASPAGR